MDLVINSPEFVQQLQIIKEDTLIKIVKEDISVHNHIKASEKNQNMHATTNWQANDAAGMQVYNSTLNMEL